MAPGDSLLTDDAETSRPNKRPRTILACLACRQKKRRCDGQRPQCQRCVRTHTTCEYTAELFAFPSGEAAAAVARPSDGGPGVSVPADTSLQQSNPGQSTSDLPPRTSSFRSPTYENGAREAQHNVPGPEISAAATYNDNVGYPPQQAFLLTDGVPDSNGLDEWTQLFLNQVFATHGPQAAPQAGPSSYNLIPGQSQVQHQHPSQYPPNSFLHPLREGVSPKSPASNKRVGRFRIPYFR